MLIDINYLINARILYITPLIICLYGIMNALITQSKISRVQKYNKYITFIRYSFGSNSSKKIS